MFAVTVAVVDPHTLPRTLDSCRQGFVPEREKSRTISRVFARLCAAESGRVRMRALEVCETPAKSRNMTLYQRAGFETDAKDEWQRAFAIETAAASTPR